jgi:hypothetical protein
MIKSDSPRAGGKFSKVENIMYIYDEKSLAIRGYGGELGLKFTSEPPTHTKSAAALQNRQRRSR